MMFQKHRLLVSLAIFICILLAIPALAISPINYPKFQAVDSNGNLLVGGKLYTYKANTSTPKAVYSDRTLTTARTNPVVLDARGEQTIYGSGVYKFVLTDANDVTIWTIDNYEIPGTGWNVSYAGTDLNGLITSLNTSNATVVIDQPLTLSASCTIPTNISTIVTKPGPKTTPS